MSFEHDSPLYITKLIQPYQYRIKIVQQRNGLRSLCTNVPANNCPMSILVLERQRRGF